MEKNKEEMSDPQLKEAVSELISKLPDDALNRAVGGLSKDTIQKLINVGLLSLAAGSAGLLWYKNSSSGEKKSKKRVRFNPIVEGVEYEIPEENKMRPYPYK